MTSSAPQHDELSPVTRFVELASMIVATGLVLALGFRFALFPGMLFWWTPIVFVLGACTADFMSGMVHWFADTWGSETMPVLGRRLLRPFRVHHVNPDDFLRRDFIDTNGDVAMVVLPFLLLGLTLPLDSIAGRVAALFFAVMGVAALPTNQVHQWAHMRHPPVWVKRLQDLGVILSRREHLRHHKEPYNIQYCISLGWCNGVLNATDFFWKLERVVTRLTGLQPREDDSEFAIVVEDARVSGISHSWRDRG